MRNRPRLLKKVLGSCEKGSLLTILPESSNLSYSDITGYKHTNLDVKCLFESPYFPLQIKYTLACSLLLGATVTPDISVVNSL